MDVQTTASGGCEVSLSVPLSNPGMPASTDTISARVTPPKSARTVRISNTSSTPIDWIAANQGWSDSLSCLFYDGEQLVNQTFLSRFCALRRMFYTGRVAMPHSRYGCETQAAGEGARSKSAVELELGGNTRSEMRIETGTFNMVQTRVRCCQKAEPPQPFEQCQLGLSGYAGKRAVFRAQACGHTRNTSLDCQPSGNGSHALTLD